MSINVTMIRNGRVVAQYGRAQTMDDVLQYLRGWIAPGVVKGRIFTSIEAPGQQPQRYEVRYDSRRTTLVRE